MPRYLIYARKSTESEDRQVLSIDSQIRELEDVARSQKLEIIGMLSESRSAKAPGREVFGQLLQKITRGEVDGILCWKLDRLARNPVDGGALIWAFDEGKLQEIATPQRTFTNTGNDKFWMQLEFGMAKKYVDDLSDNVKRGNRAKLEQGWFPGVPPVGYLNDLRAKTIVPDPDRFALIRRLWDQVLAGTPPARVLNIVNDEWGFRTRKMRRSGNRPLGNGAFYKLLGNPFYYGLIVRKGETYVGAHKPMITRDEFDRVQRLLRRPSRLPHAKHAFAFTGLIRCGECGAAITAENKINRFGSRYAYYHCTKRRKVPCSQSAIRVEKMELQILDMLTRIRIADGYRDWALKHLRAVHRTETESRRHIAHSLSNAHADTQKQIDTLVDLRLRGLVTDEEYATKRRDLVSQEIRLKERLNDKDSRARTWLVLTEQAFIFANEAEERFKNGSHEQKRAILAALGSNLTLADGNLEIQLQEPFRIIERGLQGIERRSSSIVAFEPTVQAAVTRENDGLSSVILSWRGLVNRVRTHFMEHPTGMTWPKFCMREE